MKEITVKALIENVEVVTNFINEELDKLNCEQKAKAQIDIAIDELFSNIANYAYNPEIGEATVRFEVCDKPLSVTITFMDNGVPYDPLSKEDPNVSLSAEERDIGGLGVFMVKKSMDSVEYEYKDNKNILRIKKNI
ncbi:MAG: ATP-binding protein [Lachnospiraceae bacterium]|nr:ATP-binding protein [Lachnospiraceae bacterium]